MLIAVAAAGLEKMRFEVGQAVADNAQTAPPLIAADIEELLAAAPSPHSLYDNQVSIVVPRL